MDEAHCEVRSGADGRATGVMRVVGVVVVVGGGGGGEGGRGGRGGGARGGGRFGPPLTSSLSVPPRTWRIII